MASTKQFSGLEAGGTAVIEQQPSTSTAFVILSLRPKLLKPFGVSDVQVNENFHRARSKNVHFQIEPRPTLGPTATEEPPDMQTRGAWSVNASNPANANKNSNNVPAAASNRRQKRRRGSTTNSRGVTPKVEYDEVLTPKTVIRRPTKQAKVSKKHAAYIFQPTVPEDSDSDSSDDSPEPFDSPEKENIMAGERPKLKLKLTNPSQSAPSGSAQSPPPPQSALQTPSIKLSIKRNSINSAQDANGNTSDSSAKKRKRSSVAVDNGEGPPRPAPAQRRTTLTLKAPTKPPPPQTPGGILKLTAKTKVKKRPLGVGYDSESEQTELDPVIIEGFILRMQPGPDCDYVREAIKNGTLGLPPARGGAKVSIRLLDTHGRRAIFYVKDNKYAATLVDLPCIIEGMKSWNGKEFIKSMDVGQMLLVLGRCKDDEEARNYPLPNDVNPQNYQYAHGLTAPMKYVRKRRFARTRRARVDEIEAVERKVAALLAADEADDVVRTHFEALDRDPREIDGQNGDADDDYDEEYEGEEEEDADGEPEDYFDTQHGHGGTLETPYTETPQEVEYADEDDFAALLEEGNEEEAPPRHAQPGLLAPDHGDSSFAVTSTSASPSAADAAATPASQGEGTTDDDDADDDDKDDAEKEDDEQKREALNNIAEYEKKIEFWMNELKRQTNHLLRKTAAGKIKQFEQDVKMEKRKLGMVEDEEEGEE